MTNLYRVLIECDCTQADICPQGKRGPAQKCVVWQTVRKTEFWADGEPYLTDEKSYLVWFKQTASD